MKILITIETLLTGGAEIFSLRLAQTLSEKNTVYLYRFYQEYIHPDVVTNLAPNVTLLSFQHKADKFIRKFDSLLTKTKVDYSVRNALLRHNLKRVITKNAIEVIHSNQFKVDYVVSAVASELNIPVVITVHGDYLKFWYQNPCPILNYETKLLTCLNRVSAVACISNIQLKFFTETIAPLQNKRLHLRKIYNGYVLNVPQVPVDLKRQLGIAKNQFVFGMVSRGIPEKGWEFVIQAFIALETRAAHLILVGDSAYLRRLKERYAAWPQIHFVGHSSNPVEWIRLFDVGLLPSTYASESLPTVIIEYLFCGKPVIASDAGEISNMLTLNNGQVAGTIVLIQENTISTDLLKKAMQQYLQDTALYQGQANNAYLAAPKFDMQRCLNSYMQLYQEAQQNSENQNSINDVR